MATAAVGLAGVVGVAVAVNAKAHPATPPVESTPGYQVGYDTGVQLAQQGGLSARGSCNQAGENYLLTYNQFVPDHWMSGCLAGFKDAAPPGL